jgi:hypothetical protein
MTRQRAAFRAARREQRLVEIQSSGMNTQCSVTHGNQPRAEFVRRSAGLSLAEVGPVAYWLCEMIDARGSIRVRLIAQWTVNGAERRAQVGSEWVQVSREDDADLAAVRVRLWHDDIVGGRVEGRAV